MSIKLKVIFGILVVVLFGSLIQYCYISIQYKSNIDSVSQETLLSAKKIFEQLESNDVKMLYALGDGLKSNMAIAEAYKLRDRDKVYALTIPLYTELKQKYGITHWNFIDAPPNNVIFARLSKPELFNDTVKRITYMNSVQNQSYSSGKEVGKTGFVLRTVSPIRYNNEIIGYQEIGEDMDRFIDLLKKQTGNEIALIIAKEFMKPTEWASARKSKGLSNNWDSHATNLLVSSTNKDESIIPLDLIVQSIPENGKVLGFISQENKKLQQCIFPIQDATQKNVGYFYLQQDFTKQFQSFEQLKKNYILVIAVQSLILFVLISYLLYILIFKRLTKFIGIVTRVIGGDTEVKVTNSKDELGKFENQLIIILKNLFT